MLTEDLARKIFEAAGRTNSVFLIDPSAFRKSAVALMLAALKNKNATLQIVRELVQSTSRDAFEAMVDEVKTKDVISIVSRLDKARSAKFAEDAVWAREHLAALAFEEIEPLPVPAKEKSASKARAKSKDPVVRTLRQSKAMAARNQQEDD